VVTSADQPDEKTGSVAVRQMSLFKGKRQRGCAAPAPLEFASHCVVADLLKRWCSSQWRYTHLPMGEKRAPATAMRLKRMGVKPGWPDFQFAGPQHQMFFLELKRKGSGRISEEQADVLAHLIACGFGVLVTDSVDDAVATLKDLGILPNTIEMQ
jgi:hypothetical protein